MKTYLLKALGLAALFFGLLAPAAALPPTVYTIKVVFVYTDGGLADVASRGDTALSYALRQIKYTNERYYDSGVNAVFQLVGTYGGNGAFNPPVQSIVDTLSYPMVNPGDIGAVKTARTDPNVTQARDLANADYTIVVGHYKPKRSDGQGGFYYDDIPGYSGGNCQQSWSNAIMGIDSAAAFADLNILGHEMAHALCVEHSNGYALFFGSHLTDCKQYLDIMYVNPLPFPIPTVEWTAPSQLDGAPAGWGTSAQNAFNDMTSKCPSVDTLARHFVCTSTIPCTVNQSGDSGSCPFRVDTYILLPPPTVLGGTWSSVGGANKITSTGNCPNFERTNLLSNPANIVNGMPFGSDPNHNAARTINDNAQRVSKFKP